MTTTTFLGATAWRRPTVLAWALIALLALWFAPLARATDGWVPIGGQMWGLTAIAIDPAAPDTVYASTDRAGVFKSTDGGASWATVNSGLPLLELESESEGLIFVSALAFDPATPGTLYAGAWGGVFKSSDGGASWAGVNNGLADTRILALAFDPMTPGTLYAGTWGGVFKSRNGGASWTAASNGLTGAEGVNALVHDPATPGTLYAATRDGVFKSRDGGASWVAINNGLISESASLYVGALAIDSRARGTLYAGVDNGVFKSTNGGASWTAVNGGLPVGGITALAPHPSMPGTLYVSMSYGGVFKSDDAGTTWTAVNSGLAGVRSIEALAINPAAPGTVYAAGYEGIFKSSNGGASWTGITFSIKALAIDPTAPGTFYAGTSGGVFKTTDDGSSWALVNNGLASPLVNGLVTDPSAPGTLYAATSSQSDPWFPHYGPTYPGGVFKSADGGASWTAVNTGLTWPDMKALNVWSLLLDPLAPRTLYANTNGGAFKSTDGGASWAVIDTGLSNNASVSIKAFDPATPGTVYATVYTGVERGSSLLRSTNGGASWDVIAQDNERPIYFVVVDPTAPGTLYAVPEGRGVFKSTDGGATWAAANHGLTSHISITSLVLDPAAPGTLYAGANLDYGEKEGAFKSTDGGASWTATGLDKIAINALAIDPVTRAVYAATHLNGIFKSPSSTAGLFLPDSGQPVTLTLPGGGSIEARSRQPGTQVQLAGTDSGATVAVVTAGSALLQHSAAGQPVTALPRNGSQALLTPACAGAQVAVTVTGDTRTVFSEGCAVALSGAGAQEPSMESPGNIPAHDVRVFAPGPLDKRSLLVSTDIAMPAGAGDFNLYVLAFVPGDAANPQPVIMQRMATGGWTQLTLPAAVLLRQGVPQAPNAQVLIEVEKDSDLTSLVGAEIYIGYGTSEEEMLQAGRYRAVYRVR